MSDSSSNKWWVSVAVTIDDISSDEWSSSDQ